jgi:hypothetical protein
MLSLATSDAEHEKSDARKHRHNHDQKEENRPTGRFSATLDHGDTAGGTSEGQRGNIHGLKSAVETGFK